jgi:3',5'-cyclic-AMP phosphodiesterase
MGDAEQDCCGLSRRHVMRLAAAGAAAGLTLPGLASATATAAASSAAGLYAQDLELVTVTDTGFVLTWYTANAPTPSIPYQPAQEPAPVACGGLVRYGTRPDRLDRVAIQRHGDTAYHYVEVEGLRPGTTYYYQAISAGVPATPRVLPQLTFPAGGLVIPPNPTNQQLLAILGQLLSSGVVRSAAPGQIRTLVPPRGAP